MSRATLARVAPARRVANAVVRRVFEDGAYADRSLRAEVQRAGLDARDRALATRLAYGTVQRRRTLDHLVQALADRPTADLDPPVLAALRLGLFQLAFLDTIPAHAAVGESVELVKAAGARGGGLVNAVLRRAAGGEARALLSALDDATPGSAAVKHSHPDWVAHLWWDAFGADEARALLACANRPAESALRVNTLAARPEDVLAQLAAAGVEARPAPGLPEGLVVDTPFDAHGSPLFAAGALTPQSRASMLVARVVAPEPGERVLDLCSAPGGKTTHLAALMGDEGEVVALEQHDGRAQSLRETCERMRASSVRVLVADAAQPQPDAAGSFDRVLVDPPCSALGTLQSRPDARWRGSPEGVTELAGLQDAILAAGAEAVRPGGVLVYSTCTISPDENERVVDRLLARDARFAADDLQADYPMWKHPGVPAHLQLLPHRDGTDGFFLARLRRRS